MRCARLSADVKATSKLIPSAFSLRAGLARFRNALFGQIDVAPAGEKVFQVPFALTMTHKHEKAIVILRSPSIPAHPSSNKGRASDCAPSARRARRRARRSSGLRLCAPVRAARPDRQRSHCARRPRCRRAMWQSRYRRPCARRYGLHGAHRLFVEINPPAFCRRSAKQQRRARRRVDFLIVMHFQDFDIEVPSSVFATRLASAASRLTPRLMLPDLTITAVFAASLIFASSAALKPVVPMIWTMPAFAASAASATRGRRRGEIDDPVGLAPTMAPHPPASLMPFSPQSGKRAGVPADQRRARIFQRAREREVLAVSQSP